NYGLGDNSKFISDLSFVTNSNSVGIGARFQLRKKVALNMAYFKTFYKEYKRTQNDYNGIKATMSGMVAPLSQQLQAAQGQLSAVVNNPAASAEQKAEAQYQLGIINNELGAVSTIAQGFSQLPTHGIDKFKRTNDVFGLGLEIDF
ncbi:MAG: hypothetical protein ACI4TQ_01820, partial [Alloprevotella sp.]